MSDVNHNSMGTVQLPDDDAKDVFHQVKDETVKKLHELKHHDNVHGLHRMDDLELIDTFILRKYATEEVAFGINYFGKIEVADGKCIHVRCHKSTESGNVELYSILTDETAIWPIDKQLEYFID